MRNFIIEIKWAFIFIIMMLLWMLLEKLTGLHDVHIDKHSFYTNFIAIPAVAIYVFALLDKRKNFYNGSMSYKQGFVTGMIITVIITLFTPITQYLTFNFISPDYFTNVKDYAINNGNMTPDEANKYFNFKNYIIQGLVGTLVMGLITTAIVAIFTRSQKVIA